MDDDDCLVVFSLLLSFLFSFREAIIVNFFNDVSLLYGFDYGGGRVT